MKPSWNKTQWKHFEKRDNNYIYKLDNMYNLDT